MRIKDFLQLVFRKTGSTCCEEHCLQRKFKDSEIKEALDTGVIIQRFINNESFFTLKEIYDMESDLANRIINHHFALNPKFENISDETVMKLIGQYEILEGQRLGCAFLLDKWQIEGVLNAVKKNLMILTGGPGTGKTCVLKCIDYCLRNMAGGFVKEIFYCAPTGKASRRIREAIGRNAMTLQKKIGMREKNKEPKAIYGDCLIVDEVSFLDLETAWALFKAIQPDMKLILVGDVEQLPSVGAGAVLRDMIDSKAISVTELEEPQRQGQNTILYQNISAIRKGSAFLHEGDDFSIYNVSPKENTQQKIVDIYMKKLKKYGPDAIVCLTPYRRVGFTCAEILNETLQRRVNGGDRPYIEATIVGQDTDDKYSTRVVRFKEGDPVMQLENCDEIANGDTGRIVKVDMSHRTVTVEYEDCIVTYEEKDLNQLTLAYAMSVHKSQGSEYDCVISAFLPEHKRMLNRNLIYTAVTRAKKEVNAVMDLETVRNALKIEVGYERATMLTHLIRDAYTKRCIIASAAAFNIQKSVRFF